MTKKTFYFEAVILNERGHEKKREAERKTEEGRKEERTERNKNSNGGRKMKKIIKQFYGAFEKQLESNY